MHFSDLESMNATELESLIKKAKLELDLREKNETRCEDDPEFRKLVKEIGCDFNTLQISFGEEYSLRIVPRGKGVALLFPNENSTRDGYEFDIDLDDIDVSVEITGISGIDANQKLRIEDQIQTFFESEIILSFFEKSPQLKRKTEEFNRSNIPERVRRLAQKYDRSVSAVFHSIYDAL